MRRLAVIAALGTVVVAMLTGALTASPALAGRHHPLPKRAITGWPNVLWSNLSGSQLIISTTRLSTAPSKHGDLTPEQIGTMSGARFVPLPGIPGGQRPVW